MGASNNNTQQMQDHIRSFIVYLVMNNRQQLLSILKNNGIILNNPPTDSDIISAIYDNISKNKKLKNDLSILMTNVAAQQLKPAGGQKVTITDFVKGGAVMATGFSNATGDEAPPAGGAGANVGSGLSNDPYQTLSGVTVYGTKPSNSGGFANTAVGGFLSNLFSKDNVNKYINTGLTLVQQNAANKAAAAQQAQLAQLQLSQQQAAGYGYLPISNAGAAASGSNKWVLPVVIGVVVIGIIVTAVVLSNKKPAA